MYGPVDPGEDVSQGRREKTGRRVGGRGVTGGREVCDSSMPGRSLIMGEGEVGGPDK